MIHRREILNQSINFFWTILGFAPVLVFWFGNGIDWRFYVVLGLSLVMLVLPGRVWDALMLSSDRRFYERLGVRVVRRFVQNGDWVGRMASGNGRGKGSVVTTEGKLQKVIGGRGQAGAYLKTIAMYERFHWGCFVFFLGTAVLCFCSGRVVLGSVIMTANILYNVSTLLLQQYNKIRITRATKFL